MRVLAVANQKGGCGKTTSSINVGASLSFLGKKVLLIDLDPQAHTTLGLGINPDQLEQSIFDVLNPDSPSPASLKDVTIQVEKNLWLAPAQIVLTAIEQQLSGVPKREEKLYGCLASVRKNYDFVLIDCPPNLGLLTFNALRAATEVLIPIEPSSFSIHGLDKINETIQMLRDQIQHDITPHAFLTMYDNRNRFAREMIEQVRLIYGPAVLRTVIRTNIRLREAARSGRPITRFDRHSTGFHDYLSLASEVIERGLQQKKEDSSIIQAQDAELNRIIDKTPAETGDAVAAGITQKNVSPTVDSEITSDVSNKVQTSNLPPAGTLEEEFAPKAKIKEATPPIASHIVPRGEALLKSPEERIFEDMKRLMANKDEHSESTSADEENATALESEEGSEPEIAVKDQRKDQSGTSTGVSPLQTIGGIGKYPLKVSGGYLFICKCPKAHSVQIVGDFTNWVAVNMNSPGGRSGFWTRVFTLSTGRYKYKFIVDGEWVNDINNATYERNPYGGIDSVLDAI